MTEHVKIVNMASMGLPPNNANGQIKVPLISKSKVISDLQRFGLTAADLKPIDWRKETKKRGLPDISWPKNQANCGNCWAQSSTSALTDRFIIQKKIKNLELATILTTQCASSPKNEGCGGGLPLQAGNYFATVGIVDSSSPCISWDKLCQPDINCGAHQKPPPNLPSCNAASASCDTGQHVYNATSHIRTTTVAGKSMGSLDGSATITRMKHELTSGPFPACYFVARDFYGPSIGYKWEKTNGIYINGAYNDELDKHASESLKTNLNIDHPSQWADIIIEGYVGGQPQPAGHAVEIVGWDIGDAGPYGRVPYWIVKNSWGSDWNEDGYFRIAMNDSGTTGKSYNSLLGLDVPVTELKMASTGNVISQLGFPGFGGGTVIDPDISSGAPNGHKYKPKPKSGKGSSSHIGLWIGVSILALTVLAIVLGPKIFKKFRKKK